MYLIKGKKRARGLKSLVQYVFKRMIFKTSRCKLISKLSMWFAKILAILLSVAELKGIRQRNQI